MKRKRHLAILTSVFCTLALNQSAQAQQIGINQVPVLVFEPSTSPYGILTVDSSRTLGNLKFYAGLYGSYVNDPLRAVRNGETVYKVINHQITGDLVLALGFWHYMELGVHLPAIFYSADKMDPATVGLADYERSTISIGDVRIVPKFRFWKNGPGLGLAVIPQFTVHSGFADDNAGERFMTFEPKLVLDYRFKQGTVLAFNAGYRLRKDMVVGDLKIADEFFYGFGTEIFVFRKQLSIIGEIYGAVSLKDSPTDRDKRIDIEELPVEAGGAIRYRAPFGLMLTVGGSAGLTDGWAMPDFRVFVGLGFYMPEKEPRKVVEPQKVVVKDRDNDGIPDDQDRCPDQAEDKDGFEDEDGCPDPDNDKDGVCDDNEVIQARLSEFANVCRGKDLCPDQKEDKDGFEDEDGCPDPDNDKDGICDNIPDIQKDLAKYSKVCTGSDKCTNDAEDKDGFEDEDGCPDPDNDKDGICDDNPVIQANLAKFASICQGKDKCPNDAEDKDGFEDDDGCPDPDNDKDGFCDNNPTIQNNLAKYAAVCRGKDLCPDQAETINGYKDDDGCPDRGKPKVKVVGKKIVIMEKIYFKTNRATIQKRSYRILAMVAVTMKTQPAIQLIRIEGHTDERGNDEKNMRLSEARAQAVRDFLIKTGVEADRLIAKGYGETTPVQPDCSKLRRRARRECWAKNRRVEFNIVKQAR